MEETALTIPAAVEQISNKMQEVLTTFVLQISPMTMEICAEEIEKLLQGEKPPTREQFADLAKKLRASADDARATDPKSLVAL